MIKRKLPELGTREVREWSMADVELRDADGTLTLTGYASVFNAPYDMYGGPTKYGWTEEIDGSAFDKTLREKPDVQLLINHGGLPLARTKSGTLKLKADNVGLHVEADLEPADPDVLNLAPKMRRGDIDEMSFAFRVVRQEWDDEYTARRIVEVNIDRGDVSVVNFGANPATSASLRSADVLAELAGLDRDELLVEARAADSDLLTIVRSAHLLLGDVLAELAAADADPADEWRAVLAAQRATAGL